MLLVEGINTIPSQNWVWSLDLVIRALSLIGVIATLITAVIGVRKYFYEKNRDVYIRRLNEVYAPLFVFLVKQEQFRQVILPHLKRDEFPILTLVKKTIKNSVKFKADGKHEISNDEKEETLSIMDRKNFLKVINETNKGLASANLLVCISQYEMLIYLEESLSEDDPRWKEATSIKVNVENKLIDEIVRGYIKTLKKLKLGEENSLKSIKLMFK